MNNLHKTDLKTNQIKALKQKKWINQLKSLQKCCKMSSTKQIGLMQNVSKNISWKQLL